MTLDSVYGTKPDLLPRAMIRLVRAKQTSGRQTAWTGTAGVVLLPLGEHLNYERESIGLYPRRPDGTVDWDSVADGLVIHSTEVDLTEDPAIVADFVSSSEDLVIFWGSPAMPSVRIGSDAAGTHLPAILKSVPEFWMYSPSRRTVLEHAFSGRVTSARLPSFRHSRG